MTYEKLVEIIETQIEDDTIDISMGSNLKDDIGLCSFDMMVIIALVERDGFRVDIDKLARNLTVEGLLKAITKEV